MEPVINPWAFYLIDGASDLKWGALIFGCVIGLAIIAFGICKWDNATDDKEERLAIKRVKAGCIVSIISIALFLIIPSSETVMKMVIAQNVTYDAVDAAKDVVVQVYNDILALFQK